MTSQRASAAVVWSGWAVLTLAAWWLASVYGLTSPYADEWRWTAIIAGKEPPTAEWLLASENQHRLPLGKLVYVGLGRLTDWDLRAGGRAGVLLMSAAAAALLVAVRRFRGHLRPADLALPALLLNLGHWHNFIWGLQIFYVLTAFFALVMLLLIFRAAPRLSVGRAAGVGLCLLGLATSGAGGVAYVPAIALWLLYAAAGRWRQRDRLAGAAIAAVAAASTGLVFWYFSGPVGEPPAAPPGVGRLLAGSLQFLAIGFGRISRDSWPFSGALIVAAGVAAAAALATLWRRGERTSAAGLAAFLLATLCVALGVSHSRSVLGPQYCFSLRYVTLAAPVAAALYLVAVARRPAGLPWRGEVVAAIAIAALALVYARSGRNLAREIHSIVARLERQCDEGLPYRAIATRMAGESQAGGPAALESFLAMLDTAGRGPYRRGHPPAPRIDVRVQLLQPPQGTTDDILPAAAADGPTHLQRVTLAGEGRLCRIVLRVRRNHRDRRASPAIRWRLNAVSTGQRLAGGEAALSDLPDPIYVEVDTGPLASFAGEAELRLDAVGSPSLGLPLYRVDGQAAPGVAGYLYYCDDAVPTTPRGQRP